MKLCERPGCKSSRVFFNKAHSLKVCLTCRMNYHSHLHFKRIRDSKQAKEAIETISICLEAIRTYLETYLVEDLYKGIKSELRDFELKTEEVRKRLIDAEKKDLIWDFKKIENEVFDLKRQIDCSQMMKDFTFHRFQISMDCAVKGTMNEEMKEETQVKRLLTIAKEGMVQDLERRYEEKYNRRNEELKKECEDHYRAQIEEQKVKNEQSEIIIENHKREINILKEEISSKDSKILQLEEESKKREAALELIRSSESASKCLFDFYKAKTDFINI